MIRWAKIDIHLHIVLPVKTIWLAYDTCFCLKGRVNGRRQAEVRALMRLSDRSPAYACRVSRCGHVDSSR